MDINDVIKSEEEFHATGICSCGNAIKDYLAEEYIEAGVCSIECYNKVMAKAPSFFALHGRVPVAGVDYDPDGEMCRDDYEFFNGEGRYTDYPDSHIYRECEYCGTPYCIEFGRCPDCDMICTPFY